MLVNCDNCGKETKKRNADIKRCKNLFCSSDCHDKFRSKKAYDSLSEKLGTDFKGWLETEYYKNKNGVKVISEMVYGTRKNSPSIVRWMDKLDMPRREASEAVALQWEGDEERRKAHGEKSRKLNLGKKSIRRRSIESLRKQYSEYDLNVVGRYFKNGYTYLECECVKCGSFSVKTLKNAGRGCRECSIAERTIADQSTLRAQRNKTRSWRKEVLKRDDYTCLNCGASDDLVAHHIESFASNEELRCVLSNGATLCQECHIDFHKRYGFINNNSNQFDNYMKEEPA